MSLNESAKNTVGRVILAAASGLALIIDAATRVLVYIGYEHHEIHAGSHFNYCDYDDSGLGAGETIEFALTTPSEKEVHFVFEAFSSTGATLEIFEGASGVVGGTPIIPRNNNRIIKKPSEIILVKDPTSIADDGTRAAGFLAGANRSAGSTSRDKENVLDKSTTYLLRITSKASSNDISWCSEWYEHTNKAA